MHCTRKVTEDIIWVGANDRRLAMFEGVYSVPKGVSYNSYLILDEKTVLFDTVDKAVRNRFLENVKYALGQRTLDYLIVQHMEPDHSAAIEDILKSYPKAQIVCNAKTLEFIKQFNDFEVDSRAKVVSEGDTLKIGKHELMFINAPMVHWPEVMVTYDITDKILFSADAFGTFGALNGALFADEVDFEKDYMSEARRYYTNIVGKYGTQVQALLKKASTVDIEMICPLHGFVWRKNLCQFISKYVLWSTYEPEQEGVMIAYASVYGNTENAAELLATKLSENGIKVVMFDVSVTPASEIVSESFRWSHLVFASTTYNAGIFVTMEALLADLAAHNIQNRTVAVIENGSWASTSGGLIREILEKRKNINILSETVSIKSSVKQDTMTEINKLAEAITASFAQDSNEDTNNSTIANIDKTALFNISYGLYVLTAKDGDKDNGCIINTVMQVAETPLEISIAVNKHNLTHDIIMKTQEFNISALTESTPFKVFETFGFKSGRDTDKFVDCEFDNRATNNIRYIPKHTNSYITAKVVDTRDCGGHSLFIATVTEAVVLSKETSLTYKYYLDNIKPKPQKSMDQKKGFVCRICGYVYESDTLPPDIICPLCKHGAADFEPLK